MKKKKLWVLITILFLSLNIRAVPPIRGIDWGSSLEIIKQQEKSNAWKIEQEVILHDKDKTIFAPITQVTFVEEIGEARLFITYYLWEDQLFKVIYTLPAGVISEESKDELIYRILEQLRNKYGSPSTVGIGIIAWQKNGLRIVHESNQTSLITFVYLPLQKDMYDSIEAKYNKKSDTIKEFDIGDLF